MVTNFKVIPYGARRDSEDNETVYYNLGLDDKTTKTISKHPLVYHSTLLYPYALCFLEENGNSFVYHTLIEFEGVPDEYNGIHNEIDGMDAFTVSINTMKAKAVIVGVLLATLRKKKNLNGEELSFEEKKCMEYCEKYMNWYKDADFDCDKLRIIPLHIDIRSDELGYGPVHTFSMPYIEKKMEEYEDKDRALAIYKANHEWNVKNADGTEMELDGVLTMTWDIIPDATVHKDKASEKNITQEIREKGIKSYDLYTFILDVEGSDMLPHEYEVFNIFWDGDVEGYDDTAENMDKMLYSCAGEDGFNVFVDFMEHNKFIPQSMIEKWREYKVRGVATVSAIYRVYINRGIKIQYKDLNWGLGQALVPEPTQY